MPDYALWLAVAIGCVAALMGDRTAFALLASAFVSWWVQSPHWQIWASLDFAVLSVIIRPNMGVADKLIAALFPVAWVSYCLPEWDRYNGSAAVVALQLYLTFPVTKIQRIMGKVSHGSLRTVNARSSTFDGTLERKVP